MRSVSLLLAAAGCVSATAGAEPGPRKPVLVSGTGTSGGGLFTASSSGALFELPSHAHLRVAPHAALRIFPMPQALQLAPGPLTTTWSFALTSGRVDVEMPSTAHGAVLASMGKLSAVVTTGHVALLANGDETTVANVDGEVKTVLADHWQTVPLGSIASLNRDNPNAVAKPGLAGPTLSGGQRMFFAAGEVTAMHGFRWERVPGAAHYELCLRRLPDGKVIDRESTSNSEWTEPLTPVEPGRYGLTLRAVDARGLEGMWSPEAELRVIGVILPPGGYSTDQAIFLGTGQQVQFTNTGGLEMTYQGAGSYFPAARGATLYRDKTTVIGFRLPGAPYTATARLEPRGIYADVHIGPKRALWPRDPVSIDIQLKSKSGREIPTFLQVVPKVTIGLEPVDVNFERDGNTLHAVIPPSAKPGPWVLRVDVSDQYGVELGHDFLEVATQARIANARPRIIAAPQRSETTNKTVSRPPRSEPAMASSN